MDAIRQMLAAGQLAEAISHAQDTLRSKPAAVDMRAALIELLCLEGQLERADEMLMSLAKYQPGWLAGAANLRQLMRAQHSRMALVEGRLADDVVATAGPALEALLAINLNLANGDAAAASRAAADLEAHRQCARFRVGDVEGDLRDCDDSLNGYFEGLGADGHYYLWTWSDIRSIDFHPVSTPVEAVWRRADVELLDGRQGEVFVPLTYSRSNSESEKLGRETDWQEHCEGLVTGLGQKLFLVGDDAISLDSVQRMERTDVEAAVTATEVAAEIDGSN